MNKEEILKIEFLEWFPPDISASEVLEGLEKKGGVSHQLFQVLLERICERRPEDFVRLVERAIILRNRRLRQNKMQGFALAEALALNRFVCYLELHAKELVLVFFSRMP
jgi:hypothetical protein